MCLCPISIPDHSLAKFHVRSELLVPCGHCVECSRNRINDWFVRLYSEYRKRELNHQSSYFVTVTIDQDLHPGLTVDSYGVSSRVAPWFRSFSERMRYYFRSAPRRFFCSEFGELGKRYRDWRGRWRTSTGALHFHGFIFEDIPNILEFQSFMAKTHGHLDIVKLTSAAMIRYAVSYAAKDYSIEDPALRARAFVTPGIGDYSYFFNSETYPPTSHVLINGYHYRTPRYFITKYYTQEYLSRTNALQRYRDYLSYMYRAEHRIPFATQSTSKPATPEKIVSLFMENKVGEGHPLIRRAWRQYLDEYYHPIMEDTIRYNFLLDLTPF